MKRGNAEECAKTMLTKAETDGADADVGLWEVAAMVYVGDIYALVALGLDEESPASAATPAESVWPFIR